jgi:pimeloyl-ACP methyl ester carboxylesterase
MVLTLIPVVIPVGSVSADKDSLISALVLTEAEAAALGLKLSHMDDTYSHSYYVTARYEDPYTLTYSKYWKYINFTVTLSPYIGNSIDAPDVIFQNKISGCSSCLDPGCKQRGFTDGRFIPQRPCYSPYMNGYTDFGNLSGETLFTQGDLLVKIESTTSYGLDSSHKDSVERNTLAKSRHEWFVEQVVKKITAGYLDVMQLKASAYIKKQTDKKFAYFGEDMVYLKGSVTGPNGGVAGVILDGFYYSDAGNGWNYSLITDASGNFDSAIQTAKSVQSITVKVRHTNTSPAYAGTRTITIKDFSGQPAKTDTGMSLTVATDKKAYSIGETVIIQGSVSDAQGKLADADVVIDVIGKKISMTTNASGNYRCEISITPNIPQTEYTISATASFTGYPSVISSTSFAVGEIGLKVEMNPATGEPFIGVAADGVSSLGLSVSLPGCSNVIISQPKAGKLEGSALNKGGHLTLNAAGMAQIKYTPPDYLTKDQLTRKVNEDQANSRAWAAELPFMLTYTDSSGKEGKTEAKILICRPPVMLVHGFTGSAATWSKMSTYLRGEKFDTFLVDYSNVDQPIEALSIVLEGEITSAKIDYTNYNMKLAKVDVVGHSMGGLVARHYSHGFADYDGDIRKLIMVGTPNHGVGWCKKKVGDIGASWSKTHTIPSEQLYSESPFMRTLNRGESTGAHLNPDIQYGNIYGFPDDWVVNSASAYLNGVAGVSESDVKHSPDIPVVPYVAITEYLKVWQQVNSWLISDIWRPQLTGSYAEVSKYWGDVFLISHDAAGNHENKLTSSPKQFDIYQSLKTGQNSKAIVHLKINKLAWGVIFLDPDSEIFLGNCSPQLVEVRLWKGSAAFRSKVDGHFTVPVNVQRSEAGEWWKCSPQAVVTGLGTEFMVAAGENIKIHCFEGKLIVDTPNATKGGTILSANKSVAVAGETVATINSAAKDNFWWATEDSVFLDSRSGGNVLDKIKGLRDSFSSSNNPLMKTISKLCPLSTAYGSPQAPELSVFRQFRDKVLAKHPAGTAVINVYYHCSPLFVELMTYYDVLQPVVRYCLAEPAAAILHNTNAIWNN